MTEQLQLRRGTASQLAAFTGAQGELVVDTTNNRAVVNDGATVGGWPAAKLAEVVTNTRAAVSDASCSALTTDRLIAYTALTAARTVTLPAAASYPSGTRLMIVDESGNCSATNAITVARAGSDTIDGAACYVVEAAYGGVEIESNGANAWTILAPKPNLQASLVGIGTAPDPNNVLSAYGASALFNGAGNLNVTVNKGGAAGASTDTASIIFEDGFSGRAQIGLCGDDNFHFKVSPNGSTWLDALDVNGSTGQVSFNYGVAAGDAPGFRNRIINGAFDVWQRGTTLSPLGAAPYCADRWGCVRYGDVGGFIVSKATGISQNGVNRSALHVQRTPGDTSTNPIWLQQSVESLNCHDLAGQSVILSLYVRVGANFSSPNLSVAIRSGTGTDERAGTYTGDALVASFNVPPSQTTYARFSCTGTLAANANELGVFITYSPTGTAGANDWFEILDVQLEPGQVATPFERRPIGVELALCQRYFQTAVYSLSYYCGQASFGFYQILTLPVTMRATPTTVLNNTLNYGASTTVTLSADDPSHLHFTITDSAVGSVGINGVYTASAEL